MAETAVPTGPRTFVSYSWSSPEHEEWVLGLASDLRELGVDVVLDKWEVWDGDDPYPFMERIVTDPELKKVVLVCDREYVRKADAREGGVGAEAQILTPELYRLAATDADVGGSKRAESRKFVAVLREHAPPGERLTPAFYGGRIHIDVSESADYADALDRLVKWIYDKPVYEKPPLGRPPAFVTDPGAPDTGTSTRQRRALAALSEDRPHADGAVDEYFETLAGNLPRFDVGPEEERPVHQVVVERLVQLKPVRDEVLDVLEALVRYRPDPSGWEPVHAFFQRVIPLLDPDASSGSGSGWSRDHFRIVVLELFLYATALLLRRRRYDAAAYLLGEEFSTGDSWRGGGGVVSYTYLQRGSDAVARYHQDERQNWISPEGAMLRSRADRPGLSFDAVMQADLVLAVRSEVNAELGSWWPSTLPYTESRHTVFDVFARAESNAHFDQLKGVLGVGTADELRERAVSLGRAGRLFGSRVHVLTLIGAERIATRP